MSDLMGNNVNNNIPSGYAGTTSKGDLNRLLKQGGSDEALKTASKEFAGVFVGQMMQIMNSTIDKCELGHGGKGEEVFQEMLTQEFSRTIGYSDKYGISDMIYKSLQHRNAASAYSQK